MSDKNLTNAEKIAAWRSEAGRDYGATALGVELGEQLREILGVPIWHDALRGIDLTNADLSNITLTGVDLYDACLDGANLNNATFCRVDLTSSSMRYIEAYGVRFSACRLYGADFSESSLDTVGFVSCDFGECSFEDARLIDVIFAGGDLSDSRFTRTALSRTHFFVGHPPSEVFTTITPSGRVNLVPTPNEWELTVGCWRGSIEDLRALADGDDDWPEARGEEREARRPVLRALADLCEAHVNYYGLNPLGAKGVSE